MIITNERTKKLLIRLMVEELFLIYLLMNFVIFPVPYYSSFLREKGGGQNNYIT